MIFKSKFSRIAVIAGFLIVTGVLVIYIRHFFKHTPVSQDVIERNRIEEENYWEAAAAIHNAGEKVREGNAYFQAGNYEAAAYEQAYEFGDKPVGGFKLADAYEKLGQNDRAISLLESMIQKKQLSELGVQDANEMIARLLAAKAQQGATS